MAVVSSYASARPAPGTAELCFWRARRAVLTSALTDHLLNTPRWMKVTWVPPVVLSCCTVLMGEGASHLQDGSQAPIQDWGAEIGPELSSRYSTAGAVGLMGCHRSLETATLSGQAWLEQVIWQQKAFHPKILHQTPWFLQTAALLILILILVRDARDNGKVRAGHKEWCSEDISRASARCKLALYQMVLNTHKL